MNVMLGNYPENQSDVDLNQNVEVDSRSNGTRTDMVRNCEDFRTLLTSEDRNRCEMTMETNRLISEEISYQMNRKIDELKRNLDTQITESINSAIHDSILPSIQNSFSGQNSGLGTNVDSRSSRLSRNTEGKKHQSVWEKTKCRVQSNSINHPQSRDCSLSSLDCRDDHDMVTGANPTPRMVPEFLTGRPTQSRDNPQNQDLIDPQSPTTSPQDKETISHNHMKRSLPIWNANSNSTDLREVTTLLYLQCLLPLPRHDRELASSLLALIPISPAITAKNLATSKTNAENSNERRNNDAMTGRILKTNIPNAQLATKQTIRRNDVGKALEPTSSPKTSKSKTQNQTTRLPANPKPITNKLLLS